MNPTSETMSRIAVRAVITGAAAAVVYAATGWVGLAVLALIQLSEIADRLGDVSNQIKDSRP